MRRGVVLIILSMLSTGFAFVPTTPAQAPAATDVWEFPDARGDVKGGFIDTPPVGATTPATDSTDIVAVRIRNETLTSFQLEVEFVDLDAPTQAHGGLTIPAQPIVGFGIEGHRARFQLRFWGTWRWNPGETPQPHTPVEGEFCLLYEEFDYCRVRMEVAAEIWFPENRFVAWIEKAQLLGMGERRGGSGADAKDFPESISVGTGLIDWNVRSQQQFMLADEGPDSGQPVFRFQKATANTAIRLGLRGANVDNALVGVEAGKVNSVPIVVTNRMDSRRIVTLTASTEDKSLGLQLAPSLELPPMSERVVNLLVNASSTIGPGWSAAIRVLSSSAGYPDEVGLIDIVARPFSSPTVERNILYLHGRLQGGSTLAPVCTTPVDPWFCGYPYRTWMNTIKDDPAADAQYQERLTYDPFSLAFATARSDPIAWQFYHMDAPLDRVLQLDSASPVELDLAYSARQPFNARIEAVVVAGDGSIAEGTADISIGTTATPVRVPLGVTADKGIVDAPGSGLGLMILLYTSDPAAAASTMGYLRFDPSKSQMKLPIVSVEGGATVLAGARIFGVAALNGTDEFVNPGKSTLFHLAITNEGVEEGEVEIRATAPEGWQVRFDPAQKYRLKPGQSVVPALFVTAPANGKEGDKALITVESVDVATGGVSGSLELSAVITTAIEFEDAAAGYTPDPAAQENAVKDVENKSPAAGVLLLGLAVGLAAWRRRRA